MKVIIYQLPHDNKNKFHGSNSAFFLPFNRADYNKTYECVRNDSYTAEDVFHEFNISHPKDYETDSLSVSDIVSINGREYFCDAIGWLEVIDGKLITEVNNNV